MLSLALSPGEYQWSLQVQSSASGKVATRVRFLIVNCLRGVPGEHLIHDVAPPPRLEAELHLCPLTRVASALRPLIAVGSGEELRFT